LTEHAPGHSLSEVLQKTVDEACEIASSPIGFYHFVTPDEKGLILQAWSTRTRAEYCKAEGEGLHYPVERAGVWADCIRKREPVIHNDYASVEGRRGLPEGHAALIRELVVPIFREGKIVAVLGVGNKSNHYTSRDVEMVTFLADVAWEVASKKKAEEQLKAIEHQLAQSQRLESVGRLAGGVAHDFNNLLTVINGSAAFVAEGLPSDDPLQDDVRQIAEAGNRAAKLTHQLLAFSRKQVCKPEVLDLNATIRQMDQMLRRLIGEDIDLRAVLQGDLWSVEADAGQIEQVIMNLAVNARDAMPNGGHLTFETANVEIDETFALRHADAVPGPHVMVAVTDDGTGMSAEVRERVFEPFFSTKRATQGTGLGLATVWGIVKQSRGNIWVYSEPGHGTTFKLYLPRARGEARNESRRAPAPMRASGAETVLVVEDDAPVRALMSRILRSGGYRVLTAASGQQALDLCEQGATPVDLLVTDVVMPEMSGRQVAERLARIVPRLKVVYMSGYTDNAIVHHGVLDEGVRLIAKPFTAETALRTVREALDDV
jgi:signal transduction histidine kinase/CheY-like chemotaxis protein